MENKDLSISQLTDKYKENKDEILRLNAKLIHSYKTAIANVKIVLDVKHCDSFSRHLDHTSRQIIENLQLSEDYTNLKKMTQSLAILETELKSKGKALFENLNFDNFDLSTLPEIEKLFNKEKTDDMPVEKNFRRAALELQNITRETPVKSLVGNLGLQATNSLVSDGSIKTYGDIVEYVNKREKGDPAVNIHIRHLGTKSYNKLKDLVKEKGDLKK